MGVLMLPHLFNASTDAADLSVVVGEHIGGVRPALIQMPGLRHFLLQFGDLLRRQTGAALQSLILTEIGVDGFHGFLRRFQIDELGFQLRRCLRIVHADTAHACTADLVQNPLNILPFLHIAVTGGVLLLFLANREIAAACNEDRGNTGFNGIVVVQIFRQLAGVDVQQRVNFLMVHGIDALFLPLRNRRCLIHHLPIFGGGAACGVVTVAVCIVGTAGGTLIDGVIPDGGLLRRGICGRRFLRLLLAQLDPGVGRSDQRTVFTFQAAAPLLIKFIQSGIFRFVETHELDRQRTGIHQKAVLEQLVGLRELLELEVELHFHRVDLTLEHRVPLVPGGETLRLLQGFADGVVLHFFQNLLRHAQVARGTLLKLLHLAVDFYLRFLHDGLERLLNRVHLAPDRQPDEELDDEERAHHADDSPAGAEIA